MIRLEGVTKWYPTPQGRRYVLRDVSIEFPRGLSIGILGVNGAGKSTLLRIIAGSDFPDRGRVLRNGGVSWQLGLAGGFQGSLTGRENALFVCRIHGVWDRAADYVDFICRFSELGQYFDMPVNTYSSGMRSRLAFATSMAFDFGTYLIDELTSVGDAGFRARCKAAFDARRATAGVIMVSHNLRELERICKAGALVHQGRVTFYPRIADALESYRAVAALPRI